MVYLNADDEDDVKEQTRANTRWTRDEETEEYEADHIENAKNNFTKRYGNRKFAYVYAWNVLKTYPKWDSAEPIDEDNLCHTPLKRKRE
ncbi:hypothetical protein Tco_1131050, partial [Tanacetum coccineum]